MNKVLRKRIPRDLKNSLLRNLALLVMIVLGMYLVISMIGGAETIIAGTEQNCRDKNCEDGEFTVFLPLTDEQIAELDKAGAEVEAKFSMDIESGKNKILRVMKNRTDINLMTLDDGELADKAGEVALEKRYCEENDIKIGDKITLADTELTVTGIGSVPDYDMPVKNISDASAESSGFGLAFVSGDQYDAILNAGGQKAEDLSYSYVLKNGAEDKEIKELLRSFDFDYSAVEDQYFKETAEDTVGKKEDIEEGVADLNDGAKELYEGLNELKASSGSLTEGMNALFETCLAQANQSLAASGVKAELTADNYADTLDKLYKAAKSADIKQLKESLAAADKLRGGTVDYTDGVDSAAEGAGELADGVAKLDKKTAELLDEYFTIDLDNLTSFVKASDNLRIRGAENDVAKNKQIGALAGIILMVLFTYVISVFVIHRIQNESSVIGALYALGVKKRDLLRHYITLPALIALAGGIIGTIIGIYKIPSEMVDSYNYFSIPKFDVVVPAYLFVYGIVMPPVTAMIVNSIVINKKLSQTALSLIKNEQKQSRVKNVTLKTKKFVTAFRIRQMLREVRTGITVVAAMFITLLIFMLGVNCYVLCKNVAADTKEYTKYEYMYSLKYPEKTVPAGGTPAYAESLSKSAYGDTVDLTVLGIDGSDSAYRYFTCRPAKGKSSVTISTSVQQKYGLSKGDKLILSDNTNDMDYAFTVEDICDYSAGLMVFMDIDSMRELFGQEDDHYNTVFSDKELDIDDGRLYSVTTRADIERASDVFIELMTPMIATLIGASAAIFFMVMFLMLNVMIDRASFGISLIKIFGFRTGEIRKLYLNGNTYIIAIGAAICIPLSKLCSDAMYPFLISNTACGMNLHFTWYMYLGFFAAVMALYFIINTLLVRKLKKMTPAEVLKNRE